MYFWPLFPARFRVNIYSRRLYLVLHTTASPLKTWYPRALDGQEKLGLSLSPHRPHSQLIRPSHVGNQ